MCAINEKWGIESKLIETWKSMGYNENEIEKLVRL